MRKSYLVPVKDWRTTPLDKAKEGIMDDDDGYTDVQLLPQNDTVVMAELTGCMTRPVYEGRVDIYANANSSMKLGGGVKNGKVIGVETVIRGIERMDALIQEASDGEFAYCAFEVLRRPARQRAGHQKTFLQIVGDGGDLTPAQILLSSRKADRIFSRPRPTKDNNFAQLVDRLSSQADLVGQLRDANDPRDPVSTALVEEYAGILACLDLREGIDAGVSMPASHIVHGGGAFDGMIIDKAGWIMSPVPFDYPDTTVTGLLFTEDEGNFDVLHAKIKEDPRLTEHFRQIGYNGGASFTKGQWVRIRDANRIFVRAVTAMGGVHYMDEPWHKEFGVVVTNVNGNPAIVDPSAANYPNSGGTGYTVIRQGKTGTAVWHTAVAEAALKRQGLIA